MVRKARSHEERRKIKTAEQLKKATDLPLTREDTIKEGVKKSYASFKVGKEFFALELDSIIEVLHTFDIVVVSHLPETFTGVINMRGKSIPVVDLQVLLGEEKVETEARICIIALVGSSEIGFLVDSDIEIATSEDGSVHSLPDCYTKEEGEFVDGIFWEKDRFIGILNPKGVVEVLADWNEDDAKI